VFTTSHLTKQINACFVFLVWIGLFTLIACNAKPTPRSTLASTLTEETIQTTVIPESLPSTPVQQTSAPVISSTSEGTTSIATLIPTQTGKPASTPTNLSERATLTDITQTILAEPKKQVGKEVEIVGYYRGWNLFGEASGRSPVTRSDWVIKDKSGSIYVQAGEKTDPNLSPGSVKDTNKLIRVTGFVRLTPEGQPYIEPENVEFLDK